MPASSSAYVWRPEEHAWPRDSHLARFMRTRGVGTIAELRQASVHCFQWFWDEALRDIGLEWTHRYTQLRDVSRGLPWTRWFTGGEINVTHNCIDRHVRDGHGAETALLLAAPGRDAPVQPVTFGALADLVDRCVLALRAAGVQRGEHVAAAGGISLSLVVVMFATMKLGARFVPLDSVHPEAWQGCLARCEAKIVFAGAVTAGRIPRFETIASLRAMIPELPALAGVIGTEGAEWESFLQSGGCVIPTRDPFATRAWPVLEPEVTPAEEPCLVLFGGNPPDRPSGFVHTHGGCLAQAGRDFRYAFDLQPGEPLFWPELTGGLMLPWIIIGCLLHRAPVVLDGAVPTSTDGERFWRLAATLGVATLGASPTLVRGLRAMAPNGARACDLGRLRVLASAGGAWDGDDGRWFAEVVGGGRCPVTTVAGGPALFGGLLQAYPVEPIQSGSLGGPALGIDADVFADDGKPAPPGTVGHLVCKQLAPSMTRSYLHDDGLYFATHFQRFPGAWDDCRRVRVESDGQWFAEA